MHVQPLDVHEPVGEGELERTGPSPLRSRFLPPNSPPAQLHLPSRSRSLCWVSSSELLLCHLLCHRQAPISSYEAPSGLPLLPGSSNSVLSHYGIWHCLTCFLQAAGKVRGVSNMTYFSSVYTNCNLERTLASNMASSL